MGFYLGMHMKGCKGVGSFEDGLNTAMLEDSSEFLTKARNTRNRDEDIFIDF